MTKGDDGVLSFRADNTACDFIAAEAMLSAQTGMKELTAFLAGSTGMFNLQLINKGIIPE